MACVLGVLSPPARSEEGFFSGPRRFLLRLLQVHCNPSLCVPLLLSDFEVYSAEPVVRNSQKGSLPQRHCISCLCVPPFVPPFVCPLQVLREVYSAQPVVHNSQKGPVTLLRLLPTSAPHSPLCITDSCVPPFVPSPSGSEGGVFRRASGSQQPKEPRDGAAGGLLVAVGREVVLFDSFAPVCPLQVHCIPCFCVPPLFRFCGRCTQQSQWCATARRATRRCPRLLPPVSFTECIPFLCPPLFRF